MNDASEDAMAAEHLVIELADRLLDLNAEERDRLLAESDATEGIKRRALAVAEAADLPDTPDDSPFPEFPLLLRPNCFEHLDLEIEGEIGRGGMGVVYLAEDTTLKRQVAIKAIGLTAALDERGEQRLLREARAAARLDHPNVLPIYSAGTAGDVAYIVSAYIDGPSLSQFLSDLRGSAGVATGCNAPVRRGTEVAGPRWIWRAASIARDLALALHFAHTADVVHRDVKPSNVLLTAEGVPVLADFGIASVADEPALTQSGERLGTPAYMSPEQAGAVSASTDERSDVYSLGVTLYECLTLRRPYAASTTGELIQAMRSGSPPNPRKLNRSVPRSLAFICMKAMQLDPVDRFATAKEMAEALEAALAGRLTIPIEIRRTCKRFIAAHRVAIGAVATVGLSVAIWFVGASEGPRSSGVLTVDGFGWDEVRLTPIDATTRIPVAESDEIDLRSPHQLAAGQYRITAYRDGSFVERAVFIASDATLDVDLNEPVIPSRTDMVFIAGGVYPLGRESAELTPFPARTATIDPFWIDAREVSNAEYRRYIEATGAPEPEFWSETKDARFETLPVVGVSLAEAEAYAAWVGKRLPTDAEWEVAAAGLNGRLQPWGTTETSGTAVPLTVTPVPWIWNGSARGQELRSLILASAQPTHEAALGLDLSSNGLINMLGNVREWTESRWSSAEAGLPGPVPAVVKGWSWADAEDKGWTVQDGALISQDARLAHIGFRCAISADPPQNFD